jgi:hypothetical protein
MMRAAQDAGVTLHFAGGWRSRTFADAEFYRRYTRTTNLIRHRLTDKKYDGSWWSLNPGEIGVATPGNSWHTYGDDLTTPAYLPAAIDWWGDLKWMQTNCARFGLRSFQHIPGEGHHAQPQEYPGSRSDYKPKHRLGVWPLPAEDDDMAQQIRVEGDPTTWRLAGHEVRHILDGNISASLLPITGPTIVVPNRLALSVFDARGTMPPGWAPSDFASWTQ